MSTHSRRVRFDHDRLYRDPSAQERFDLPEAPRSTRLRIPQGAPAEITRTVQEEQRKHILLTLESLLNRVGQMSVADLTKLAQSEGYELMRFAQGLTLRATEELDDVFLKKFNVFLNRSLEGGSRSILELQYLGSETIEDILASTPQFPIMPPKEQGLIRQIVSKMFGLDG